MHFDILDVKVIRLTENITYKNTDCVFHTHKTLENADCNRRILLFLPPEESVGRKLFWKINIFIHYIECGEIFIT